MSDLPPLPPGYRLRDAPGPEATTGPPPLPPGYTLREQPAAPPTDPGTSWGDWGRAAMTVGVRGLTGLADALPDPLAPLRRLVSPDLERIEQSGVVHPGQAAGSAIFGATGVPEFQPTSPLGRIGMSAATSAVGGAPFGPIGAVVGALGGGLGQTAKEATGSDRWETAASLLPGGALTAAGARARSRTTPELEAAGVNPTIGQALGGFANRLEQGFGSIPILGDFVRSGRAGAVEEFNRGAINGALANIGEELNPRTPLGRPAIDEASGRIGAAYDRITPQLNVSLDPQFGTGLTDIFRRAGMLSRDHQQQFGNTFRTEVMDRLNGGSSLTGQAFRDAESTLGTIARDYRHSPMPADRGYGNLVSDLQAEMRDLLRRSNPQQADALQNIHDAYRHMARVELAAARMGTGLGGQSEPGVFTPSQLTSAARQMDPSLRDRSFARGNAVLQNYAEGGKTLLGDTLPDSGTPYRSLAALGLGAAGGGLVFDPATLALGGGAGLGAGLLYSGPGRAAINYFLRRPEQAAVGGLLAGQERR